MVYSHYNDYHSTNGKRQPCPQCESKTAYTGRHCFKCGFTPKRDKIAPIAPLKAAISPKCACGNDLKKRQSQCFNCQVITAYQQGQATPEVLARNEYAKKKQLNPTLLAEMGSRASQLYDKPCLIIPLKSGELMGYQVIFSNGRKLYAYPPHDETAFFHAIIGNPTAPLILCEGIATGISLATALHEYSILVAGNAHSLTKAAKLYGEQIKIIAADNDQSRTGFDMAYLAAQICNAKVTVCPVDSDYNDLHTVQGLAAISEEFNAPYLGNLSLNLARQARIKTETITSLNEYQAAPGVTVLLSPMGTGKTKIIASQLAATSPTFAYVSYLKSLDSDASAKLGLTSYQTTQSPQAKMSICINSLEKYGGEFETLFIDEVHAVLDTLTLPHSTIPHQKTVFDNLLTKINHADQVICATATINLAHLQTLKMMAGKACQVIRIVINTETPPTKQVTAIDFETFTTKWQNSLANGQKVFIFCDSKENVKTIESQAKTIVPTAKILAIHGDNSHDHMPHLAATYTEYDMVIVSPSVSAGVSLELPHFDLVMAYYASTHLSPLDATQALARYRPATEIFICVDKQAKIERAPYFDVSTELERIRQDAITQLRQTAQRFDIDLNQAIASYKFTVYDHICALNRAQAENNRAQFKPQFLATIAAQNWHTTEPPRGDGLGARHAHQTAKAEVIMAECLQIAATDLISDFEAETLSNKMELSEMEKRALKRYQTHTIFNTNDPEHIKTIYQKDFIQRARTLAQYHSPNYVSMKFERNLQKITEGRQSIVQLENRIAEHEHMAALFECVSISYSHDGFDFTKATFSVNTDFSRLESIRDKYHLFKRQRTQKPHVLAANALRKLGFLVESHRAPGGRQDKRPYIFTVTGINPLVVTGMAYFLEQFTESTTRQEAEVNNPTTENGHTEPVHPPKSEPIGSLLEPATPPPCRHDPVDDTNGQPTCPTCGKTWANYSDYITEFIELGGKY